MKGIIFNIQRFCLHDGPGIRTTVFFKGCPLRCLWCHNPAGLSPRQQVKLQPNKCFGCGACVRVCQLHTFDEGIHQIRRTDCQYCMACAKACPSGALQVCGSWMSVDELVAAVMADKDFYEDTGGVTFSGGEPLRQYPFVAEVAKAIKAAGYTVTVDTCGEVAWEAFEAVMPHTDLFLYDVKAVTPQIHRHATGVDNTRILQNLAKLDGCGKDLWVRVPVIPTINASIQEMTQIAKLVAGLGHVKRVTLMPYHSLGHEGYAALGYTYGFDATLAVSDEEMVRFTDIFLQHGLTVH